MMAYLGVPAGSYESGGRGGRRKRAWLEFASQASARTTNRGARNAQLVRNHTMVLVRGRQTEG